MGVDAVQWVLSPSLLRSSASSNWRDVVVLLPILGGALSVLHLSFHALHIALIKKRSKPLSAESDPDDAQAPLSYVEQLGGRGVFDFRVIRAIVALALFASVGVVQVVCGEGVRTLLGSQWENVKDVEIWGMFGIYVRPSAVYLQHIRELMRYV